MKNIKREFTIAAAGSLFGMITISIIDDSTPELIPKIIIWFLVISFAIICIWHTARFLISEKRNKVLNKIPFDHRQKLYNYLSVEWNIIALESDLMHIEDICNEDLKEENKNLRECLQHIAEATNDGKSIFQQSINSMATKHLKK